MWLVIISPWLTHFDAKLYQRVFYCEQHKTQPAWWCRGEKKSPQIHNELFKKAGILHDLKLQLNSVMNIRVWFWDPFRWFSAHFSTGQTANSCHLFILLCLCNVKNTSKQPFCFEMCCARCPLLCRRRKMPKFQHKLFMTYVNMLSLRCCFFSVNLNNRKKYFEPIFFPTFCYFEH